MTTTTTPKMMVKLGEANELKFMLSIKGSTSDPTTTRPTIRFLITEEKTGMSIVLPMERLKEGMVGVTIPDLPHVFHESAEYTGKVEVIVGNRYFVPTQVGLVFERELEVSAAPVLLEEEEEYEEESVAVKMESPSTRVAVEELKESAEEEVKDEEEARFDSVIKPEPKKKQVKPISESFTAGLLKNAVFTEKKKSAVLPLAHKQEQQPSASARTQEPSSVDPNKQKMKNSLKNLLTEAWNELEE